MRAVQITPLFTDCLILTSQTDSFIQTLSQKLTLSSDLSLVASHYHCGIEICFVVGGSEPKIIILFFLPLERPSLQAFVQTEDLWWVILTYFCQLGFTPCKSPVLCSHTAFLGSFLFGKTNKKPQITGYSPGHLGTYPRAWGFSSGYLLFSRKALTSDAV